MISEKLYNKIDDEGRKNGFKIWECYGERDKDGNFFFIIKLKPTDERSIPYPPKEMK